MTSANEQYHQVCIGHIVHGQPELQALADRYGVRTRGTSSRVRREERRDNRHGDGRHRRVHNGSVSDGKNLLT